VQAARVAAEEEDRPHLVREYLAKADALARTAADLRVQAAELARVRAAETAQRDRDAREKLLASSTRGGPESTSRREMLDQAALLDKNRDILGSLKRITQMVGQELERMTVAEQVLADDAATIQSTFEEHEAYRGAAQKSAGALRDFEDQERGDRLVVIACFSVFLSVVLWIIYKRTIGWII